MVLFCGWVHRIIEVECSPDGDVERLALRGISSKTVSRLESLRLLLPLPLLTLWYLVGESELGWCVLKMTLEGESSDKSNNNGQLIRGVRGDAINPTWWP